MADPEPGWVDLEDAVRRRDWAEALRLARELEQHWETVRGHVEIFFGPGDDWARELDQAIEGLLDALSAHPVDPVEVGEAMSRIRRLKP